MTLHKTMRSQTFLSSSMRAAALTLSAMLMLGLTAPLPAIAADGRVTVACSAGSFEVVTEGASVNVNNTSTCEGAAVIPEGVISIAGGEFNNPLLTSVSIPASLSSIGYYVFFDANGLTSFSVANASATYSAVDGVLFNRDQTQLVRYPSNKGLNSYVVPASTVNIMSRAFKNLTRPTTVTFANSSALLTIEDAAFEGATGLTSITLPEGLQSIGTAAFLDATGLTSISFPSSLTSIGVIAFQNATSLASITFAPGSRLSSINQEAFKLTALTSLPVPASVSSIRYDVVDGVPNFEAFEVDPANSSYMDVDGVLYNKSQTQLIKYPAGKVGSSFTVPASVREIGNAAVRDTDLSSVNFSEGTALTTIGASAFASNAALTSMRIPEGVTTFGNAALGFNTALTQVTIPSTATEIPTEMFSGNTALRSVVFSPNSLVATIGVEAFKNTPLLKDLLIPASVTAIQDRAFLGDLGEERRLYFAGDKPTFGATVFHEASGEAYQKRLYVSSEASWEQYVSQDDDNDWVQGVNVTLGFYSVTFNSASGTAVASGFNGVGGIVAAPITPTRRGHTFVGWENESGTLIALPLNPPVDRDRIFLARWAQIAPSQTIEVPCTSGSFEVETRGDGAYLINGQTCEGAAVVPSNVTSIADQAFYPGIQDGVVPRTNLTAVTFATGSQLEYIGDRAFSGANLSAIELPASLRIIGEEAFKDVPLTSVTFGQNSQLEDIRQTAFRGGSFHSFTLPETVTRIGAGAFSLNSNLASFRVPARSSLAFIGYRAFWNTPALVEFLIPASVNTIDSRAFEKGDAVTKNFYFLGNKPAYVGDDVFAGFDEETAKIYVPRDFNVAGFNWFAPYWAGTELNDDGDNIAIADVVLQFYVVDLVGASSVERVYGRGSGIFGEVIAPMAEPAAPTRDGYSFAGWAETIGGAAVAFPYTPAPDSVTTLYATWSAVVTPASTPVVVQTPVATPVPAAPQEPTPNPTPVPEVANPAAPISVPVIRSSSGIAFSSGSVVLAGAQKLAIKKVVQKIGRLARFEVVGGAALISGVSESVTRNVARKRGEAVKAYLKSLGVRASLILVRTKVFPKGALAKTLTSGKSSR